jgi:Mlc titration factor MtfA (ptsG expression regulator)
MFKRWWQGLRARRDHAAVSRRAIPDDLWKRTLVRYPFLQRQAAADAAELRRLTSLFSGSQGIQHHRRLAPDRRHGSGHCRAGCIAGAAPGAGRYDSFVGIVVHPDQVVARREQADDDGVVHAYDELLSGEAMEGGPVTLSWRDVRTAGQHAASGYNVVIHEFAHVLDMADGLADGVPLLPSDLSVATWTTTLNAEFERLCGLGRRR